MIKKTSVPEQKIRSQKRGIKNSKSLAERSRKHNWSLVEKVPEGELAELLARKKKRKRTGNGTDPTEQLLDDHSDALSARRPGKRRAIPRRAVGTPNPLTYTQILEALLQGVPANTEQRNDGEGVGVPAAILQEPAIGSLGPVMDDISQNHVSQDTESHPFTEPVCQTPGSDDYEEGPAFQSEDTGGPADNMNMKHKRHLRDLGRVCVFMNQWVSTKNFWALLRNVWRSLCLPMAFPVQKVITITRPHQKVRVDLYLSKGTDVKVVAKTLKTAATQWNLNWHVKTHMTWKARHARPVALIADINSDINTDDVPGELGPGDGPHNTENTVNTSGALDIRPEDTPVSNEATTLAAVTSHITMATLNVCHAKNKCYDIERYLARVQVLCLQETHISLEDGFPLQFRNHQIFTTPAKKKTPGAVGMSVIVSNDYPAQVLTKGGSDFALAVRLTLPDGVWIVVCTYIPCPPYDTRKQAFKETAQLLQQLSRDHPQTPISCMGDFNSKPKQLALFLSRQSLPFGIREFNGNARTHFRAGKVKSTLDYILVNSEACELSSKAWVNRNLCFSDHWPVETKVRTNLPQLEAAPDIRLLAPDRIAQHREGIRNDPAWDPLVSLVNQIQTQRGDTSNIHPDVVEHHNVEVMAHTFKECTEHVASKFNLSKTKVIIKGSLCKLSPRTRYLVAQRQRMFNAWRRRTDTDAAVCSQLYQRFLHAKQLAKVALKSCKKHAFQKHMATTMGRFVRQSDLRTAWRWSNRLLDRHQRDKVEAALWNLDHSACLSKPTEINGRFAEHFETLLSDPTGLSADKTHWAQVIPLPDVPIEALDNINHPITWLEVQRAINKLRNCKASGVDEIPNEFLKCATEDFKPTDRRYHNPQFKQGKCILGIINILFNSGVIPSAWNISVITAIYKGKWDKSDCVNYRGICVSPTMLTLVSKIAAERLYLELERRNYFTVCQAGFRQLEECPTHTLALYDIIKRRCNVGLQTFAIFLDVVKAYDNVCHEGILRKLETIGVTGNMLRFIRALYTDAKVRVRTKSGLSYIFSLLKGLRQGCPLSCVLFNIFINSVLDESEANGKGVTVPGLVGKQIAGLLFADDGVPLTGSLTHAKESLALVVKAFDTLELTLGVKKCGIMAFGNGARESLAAYNPPISYRDERIPIVSEYKYLGTWINDELDLCRMAAARAEKGRTILAMLQPVLRRVCIPIQYRCLLVKLLLGPALTWGAEVWGSCLANMDSCVKVWGKAALSLMRLSHHNTTVTRGCVGMELGLPTLQGMIISARARVWMKMPQLRTVAYILSQNPHRCRNLAWFSSARKWFATHYPDVVAPEALQLNQMDRKVFLNTLRDDVDHWICLTGNRVSMVRYHTLDLRSTRKWRSYTNRLPYDGIGFHWFARLRTGSIYTMDVLCRMLVDLAPRWKTHCPFCEAEGKETILHLLFHCTRWAGQRATYLLPLQARTAKFGGPTIAELPDDEKLCFLIGGSTIATDELQDHDLELDGDLRTLALCNEPDFWSNQPALIDRVDTRSLDAYGNIRTLFDPIASESGRVSRTDMPVFILVARFLSSVMPVRKSILREMDI